MSVGLPPIYFNKWLPIKKLLIYSFDKAVLLLYLPMKCSHCILITWYLFLSLSSKLYILLRITCFFASMSFVRYIFISCKSLSFYLMVVFNCLSFGFILSPWYTNIFTISKVWKIKDNEKLSYLCADIATLRQCKIFR